MKVQQKFGNKAENKDGNKDECFFCHKPGHRKVECLEYWKWKAKEKQEKNKGRILKGIFVTFM
jgi:hypothetical protein